MHPSIRSALLVACVAGLGPIAGGCDMREFGESPAMLEVTTVTEGDVIDEDGYVVSIDDEERPVGPNDLAVFTRLEPGTYTVVLDGVARNCLVAGGPEQEISLSAGDGGALSFHVVCADVGANILFESDREGGLDLHTIDFVTGIVRALTDAPGPDFDPAVSPDGMWIAFTSRREGNLEIYRMRPDGSAFTNLTKDPGSDTQPAFSPDGTRIAFTSNRDGNLEIYVMAANGAQPVRVTNRETPESQPVWLTDSHIVYASETVVSRLYVLDLASGEENPLTLDPSGGAYPAVSPDGTRLAYAALIDGNMEIVISASDGSNPQRLTDHPADDLAPAFSPDGSRIAFASDRTGSGDIFLMNVDGAGVINLTSDRAFDFKPVFLPASASKVGQTARQAP